MSPKSWPSLSKKKKGEEDMSAGKSRWLERIEISVPFLEILDEKFFGVSQFMNESSFIFGGAVAAILLGEPIAGDLDIAVSQHDSSELVSGFSSSPKWLGRGKSDVKGDAYRNSNMEARVSQIYNFTSFGSAKVQVITSRSHTENKIEDALDVIRGVDFSFCALGIDFQGQIFETLRGAYEDCLKKKIRIVREKNELSGKSLSRRIDKYIKRGFTCIEDYSALLKELEGREPEKKAFTYTPMKARDLVQRHVALRNVHDARRLLIGGELLSYYNITSEDDRFDNFTNYINDVLSQVVSENSPECIDNEISAEVYWDTAPAADYPEGTLMFSFDPYDPNTNWGAVEDKVTKAILSHPFLQGA